MERVKKHQGEERGGEGEGEKPTLILLTNQCQVSAQPGLHTWSAWEGELAPPAMVDKAVQALYEWCMDMTAMGCPDTPILHLPLPGPLAHAGSWRGDFCSAVSPPDCQDSSQSCSCPSATAMLLVKQLKTEITFLSFYISLLFSEDHSLHSF